MKTQRIFLLLIISFTSSFLLLNANTLKTSQVLFPELLTTISGDCSIIKPPFLIAYP